MSPSVVSRIFRRLLPTPKEYEKVEFILKRDGITFVPPVVLFLVLGAVPLGGYFLIQKEASHLLLAPWFEMAATLAGSAWYLFALVLFFTQFTDFFLDVWVVTNERIITINQRGLFYRTVSQARLYQVQNVRTEVKGAIQTFFHFGDLIVETAGETGQLLFDNIPNPNEVARRIMELTESDRKYHEEKIKMMKLEEHPRIIDSGV